MNEFFGSLKSDLLDRRFLPVLALLGVALVAALAYAVLSGGSSTSSTPPLPSSASTGVTGRVGVIAISPAPANPKEAVSETTSGAHHQSGTPRNPFTPLPSTKAKSSTTASSSSSSSTHASSSSGSGKPSSSSGGTTPAATLKPIAPTKRVIIHFHTTAQFGVVPPSAEGAPPPPPPQLQTYKDMALDEPLPGKDNPQLVYLGVVFKTGKNAVFGLTGEAILHGSAICKPSPSQCQAIELGIGQTETLEVSEPNGQAVTYELKLLSISKSASTASAARAHAASRASSRVGRELLRRAGLSALPGLRYSSQRGGLVSVGPHRDFGARSSARRR
jgi:hypothetical protein